MRAMVAAAAAAAKLRHQKQVRFFCSEKQQHLKGLRIAITTPANYAGRLTEVLRKEGAVALPCPTIQVERTPAMRQDFERVIWNEAADAKGLASFKGIAFVSRSGIAAFAEALKGKPAPLPRLEEDGNDDDFLVGSLGQDAELIKELGMFDLEGHNKQRRVKLVVPSVATPDALIQELGDGCGRRLLCPVPHVEGLEEPPVVPAFLAGLKDRGWNALRLNAYLTKWLGPDCIEPLICPPSPPPDALVFTSTAEVEGLLKSLSCRNMSIRDVTSSSGSTKKRCLLVAYGPVTAEGAEQLGVRVDLVGHNFNSFVDLVGLLIAHYEQHPLTSINISNKM